MQEHSSRENQSVLPLKTALEFYILFFSFSIKAQLAGQASVPLDFSGYFTGTGSKRPVQHMSSELEPLLLRLSSHFQRKIKGIK